MLQKANEGGKSGGGRSFTTKGGYEPSDGR